MFILDADMSILRPEMLIPEARMLMLDAEMLLFASKIVMSRPSRSRTAASLSGELEPAEWVAPVGAPVGIALGKGHGMG